MECLFTSHRILLETIKEILFSNMSCYFYMSVCDARYSCWLYAGLLSCLGNRRQEYNHQTKIKVNMECDKINLTYQRGASRTIMLRNSYSHIPTHYNHTLTSFLVVPDFHIAFLRVGPGPDLDLTLWICTPARAEALNGDVSQ